MAVRTTLVRCDILLVQECAVAALSEAEEEEYWATIRLVCALQTMYGGSFVYV